MHRLRGGLAHSREGPDELGRSLSDEAAMSTVQDGCRRVESPREAKYTKYHTRWAYKKTQKDAKRHQKMPREVQRAGNLHLCHISCRTPIDFPKDTYKRIHLVIHLYIVHNARK